jgi:hypothetical protein
MNVLSEVELNGNLILTTVVDEEPGASSEIGQILAQARINWRYMYCR